MCLELALIILLRKVTERIAESGRGFQASIEKGLSGVGRFAKMKPAKGKQRIFVERNSFSFSTKLLAGRSRR